jgi:hypothetical protein
MGSPLLPQDQLLPAHQRGGETEVCTDGTGKEQTVLLQEKRQAFDMAIDDALDGLSEVQQILSMLKVECFSVSTGDIASPTKLKVQRAAHHCKRLIAEIQELLQPLSHDGEVFHLLAAPLPSQELY